jgi:putative N6-adenine-specific DNA methylase
MIGINLAPGLKRQFVSEKWWRISNKLWKEAREEAVGAIKKDITLNIKGYDIDENAIKLSKDNARKAGVEKYITFENISLKDLKTDDKYGVIICNPPYGERMGELKEVEKLYKEMGKVFKKLDTWSFYILTSHERFEKLFGREASKKRKLYNGMLKAYYYQYYGPKPEN